MTCAVKDLYTGHYYTGNATAHGYYHPQVDRARLYTRKVFANQAIALGGHHIEWPGNRNLVVVNIKVEETP